MYIAHWKHFEEKSRDLEKKKQNIPARKKNSYKIYHKIYETVWNEFQFESETLINSMSSTSVMSGRRKQWLSTTWKWKHRVRSKKCGCHSKKYPQKWIPIIFRYIRVCVEYVYVYIYHIAPLYALCNELSECRWSFVIETYYRCLRDLKCNDSRASMYPKSRFSLPSADHYTRIRPPLPHCQSSCSLYDDLICFTFTTWHLSYTYCGYMLCTVYNVSILHIVRKCFRNDLITYVSIVTQNYGSCSSWYIHFIVLFDQRARNVSLKPWNRSCNSDASSLRSLTNRRSTHKWNSECRMLNADNNRMNTSSRSHTLICCMIVWIIMRRFVHHIQSSLIHLWRETCK